MLVNPEAEEEKPYELVAYQSDDSILKKFCIVHKSSPDQSVKKCR